jgi:hypothetical protein
MPLKEEDVALLVVVEIKPVVPSEHDAPISKGILISNAISPKDTRLLPFAKKSFAIIRHPY